jgi:hypothetical protein
MADSHPSSWPPLSQEVCWACRDRLGPKWDYMEDNALWSAGLVYCPVAGRSVDVNELPSRCVCADGHYKKAEGKPG